MNNSWNWWVIFSAAMVKTFDTRTYNRFPTPLQMETLLFFTNSLEISIGRDFGAPRRFLRYHFVFEISVEHVFSTFYAVQQGFPSNVVVWYTL